MLVGAVAALAWQQPLRTAGAAGAAGLALGAAGVVAVNGVFGVLDNTADELADMLHVDEVPAVAAGAVRLLRPVYAPLKAVSPSCTAALFPEFNDMLDMNDCLLLPRRVFWRPGGGMPITISQTMRQAVDGSGEKNMWEVSTGSTVWGGGVVLQRYLEGLGPAFFEGKRVLELGTGTGLGGVTAAKLGAREVVVTDRDAAVLELARTNARANLDGAALRAFRAERLEWGPVPAEADAFAGPWDLVLGADLTYNRDAWPVLVQTIKRLDAPALLSASERRTDELSSLASFLAKEGLAFELLDSPLADGYAGTNVKLLRIERYGRPSPPSLGEEAAR